ncbi:MAG: dipeptidase [Ardenticatenaceae bacterium]|nr:dipeptidase [Ardenticatenaceae bacterium]
MRITEEQAQHARDLHEQAVVIAAHTDICPDIAKRQRNGETHVFARRHLPVLRRGGLTAVCDHVAGDAPYLIDFPFRNTMATNRLKFALQAIEAIYIEAESSPDEIGIAISVDDILAAKRDGRVAIVLCFEGAGPVEDDPSLLDIFHRLGIRCIGLTHNFRNLLADGVAVGGNNGLTALGREAVREMNRLGIVVDVSHMTFQGFWDVIETSTAPVHASHSSCFDLVDHPRNLTDDMLRALAQTGGVVGVHPLSVFITNESRAATFDELLDHIEHMVEVMGADHVAIGPDIMENFPAEEYTLLWQDVRLPEYHFVYPEEFDSLAKFPAITAGLVARGCPDETIVKILGGNMLRLFSTVWSGEKAQRTGQPLRGTFYHADSRPAPIEQIASAATQQRSS